MPERTDTERLEDPPDKYRLFSDAAASIRRLHADAERMNEAHFQMMSRQAAELQNLRAEVERLRMCIGNVWDHCDHLCNDIRTDPGFDNMRMALDRLFESLEVISDAAMNAEESPNE